MALVAMMVVPSISMAAEPTVNLGTSASFAVLAGTTVTNTGSSVINGDLGVWPGLAITGFPPGIVNAPGAIHAGDGVALQAQSDLVAAYLDAEGRTPVTQDLTGQDLGGLTLTPGYYHFDTSAQLTGTLTLDAQGDPEAVFIFQIGSTLTTASNSSVNLINGARFCRVFWQVGSSATLGTTTDFYGHILALTSITANNGATVTGQLMARNGAVTLDSNVITSGVCATSRAINIAKTASPAFLTAAGPVAFTYLVTNPGTVVLGNIVVTDDKVSPVTYVSGDTNSDNLLQPGETWRYTSTATITTTTTNVATVTGNDGGTPLLTATDTASLTVVVGARTVTGGELPKTATPWYNVLVASIVVVLLGAVGLLRTTRKTNV
jgi:uncharacterized repeat protein (TIGR01451 family)